LYAVLRWTRTNISKRSYPMTVVEQNMFDMVLYSKDSILLPFSFEEAAFF
jgi:hypothetical protein